MMIGAEVMVAEYYVWSNNIACLASTGLPGFELQATLDPSSSSLVILFVGLFKR